MEMDSGRMTFSPAQAGSGMKSGTNARNNNNGALNSILFLAINCGSTRIRVSDFCMIRERWQKMRDDLHGQVLFIAEAVRLALDDANGVVQPLDATERDFIVGLAVRNDAVPMAFDHVGELLKGFQPLPLETGAPV